MAVNNYSSSLFDAAQKEIYMLMDKDNFSRFKRSELFQQLMKEINVYQVGTARNVCNDWSGVTIACRILVLSMSIDVNIDVGVDVSTVPLFFVSVHLLLSTPSVSLGRLPLNVQEVEGVTSDRNLKKLLEAKVRAAAAA